MALATPSMDPSKAVPHSHGHPYYYLYDSPLASKWFMAIMAFVEVRRLHPASSRPCASTFKSHVRHYRSLWATMKVSDDKVTHHSYQKLASELNGEARFTCPQGVHKLSHEWCCRQNAGNILISGGPSDENLKISLSDHKWSTMHVPCMWFTMQYI